MIQPKKNTINNNENVSDVKGYSCKTYVSNNYKPYWLCWK